MLIVSDVWPQAKKIFGICDEPQLLREITDAVEMLASKGDTDALVGYVDICVDSSCVTLPREVETVLAVNIAGRPSLGRDELFSFHLNGPGDSGCGCDYTWSNAGGWPTYRDLRCPGKLIAFLDSEEDAGTLLRVYGFDGENRPLRTQVNGVWQDGYLVPTIFGYALPDSAAPTISRITFIDKELTVGNVRLSTFDNSTTTGTLLGVFEPDETKPHYRRIKINRSCDWVRIAYRKKSLELRSTRDRIYLHSRLALILAMQAVKKYQEFQLADAVALEAHATRMLTEKEAVLTSPTANPIQVNDRGASIKNGGWDDVE